MTARPTRGLAALVTVLLAAVLAAGCADTPPPPTAAPADVAFVSGMLPHHRQAVAMSALATGRASSPQVRDLAATIDREQGPEIARMTGMLASWGASEAGHDGHAMPGMMGDDAMPRLAGLSGPAFDEAFLRMMIEHHDGAVRMAATETAEGRDPAALDLARSITTAQQAEIGRMSAMLQRR